MNKFFVLLGLVVFLGGCSKHCGEDGPKIHKATKPIVEAIAAYAKEHGEPKSILDVKGIPYTLMPCSERPQLHECITLKGGYYFKIGDDSFAIRLDKWGGVLNKTSGFWLISTHQYTDCDYTIFENGQVTNNYLEPRCGVLSSCGEGWKQ